MKTPVRTITEQNEIAYEKLVAVIEANSDSLALLIAVCDDEMLRNTIIKRYEDELNPNILAYRLVLNPNEPSLRDAVKRWVQKYNYPTTPSVLTVTGAEYLLWLKIRDDDQKKTDIEKFFGYLQWGREGLRDVQRPVVLWVTSKIFTSLSRKAPDFWSWRKGVFRFVSENSDPIPRSSQNFSSINCSMQTNDDFALSIEGLQEQIRDTENQDGVEVPILGTLYARLAKAYQRRIEQGHAENIDKIQGLTISCYEKAIELQENNHNNGEKAQILIKFGDFYQSQGKFSAAVQVFQQSLDLAKSEDDRDAEATSLGNLGIAFQSLGQYQKAIDFCSQSLEISREIGDQNGEAASLGNLGIVYRLLGDYQKAIDFFSQSLQIEREIGDQQGEATSLGNLGIAFESLGNYQKAIDFCSQSLEISRETGDRKGEAKSLGSLGAAYQASGEYQKAIDFFSQSLQIKREIGDRKGEATSLGNLGVAYRSLGQYQKAFNFHLQHNEISYEIGDRNGEALSLYNMAYAYAKLDRSFDALQTFKLALDIFEELELEQMVTQCNEAIAGLHQVIQGQRITAPTIGEAPKSSSDWLEKSLPVKESRPASNSNPQYQWLWYFLLGLGLAILIWWVKNQ